MQTFPILSVVCIRERPDLVFNTLPAKSKPQSWVPQGFTCWSIPRTPSHSSLLLLFFPVFFLSFFCPFNNILNPYFGPDTVLNLEISQRIFPDLMKVCFRDQRFDFSANSLSPYCPLSLKERCSLETVSTPASNQMQTADSLPPQVKTNSSVL